MGIAAFWRHRFPPLVASTLLLAGCGALPFGSSPPRDLASARAAWKALGLKDYTLAITRSCFCENAGTVTIRVKDGNTADIAATAPGPNGTATAAMPPVDTPTTVERLLDRVAKERATAGKVDVTYDDRGVPTAMHVDHNLNGVDDEEDFIVSVVATPTPAAALADARARWSRAPVTDYDLVVSQTRFCGSVEGPRVRGEVRGGSAVRTVLEAPDGCASTISWQTVPATVEALFDLIAAALPKNDQVDVTYDPTTGVPRRIEVNPSLPTYDDEWHYTVELRGPGAGPSPTPAPTAS